MKINASAFKARCLRLLDQVSRTGEELVILKRGQQEGPATAIVHPDAAHGFTDGEPAVVASDLGGLTVRLRFDPRQRADVVLMEKGGWLSAGRCANALIRAAETDAGGCAVYHDTPVRLEKIRDGSGFS